MRQVASGLKPTQAEPIAQLPRALIGQHPLTLKTRSLIERVAATDATVLIIGESGTGKEIVARRIHALSERRNRPFVPVNCAAIPEQMLESEMFGHERGAFTGAILARQGLFTLANDGTIFLDEVSEMPLTLQAKLLRVLEDRMVRPLGSDRAGQIDVRVIAASNRDLALAARNKTFREDLFYRLQVIPITVAPLRERRSDIPILADHFLERTANRRKEPQRTISSEAMVHLWSYDWPGNVRELENLIERLVILGENDVIDVPELPPNVTCAVSLSTSAAVPDPIEGKADFVTLVRAFEGRLLNDALRKTGGNKQAAARLLSLKRTTFTAMLRRNGVLDPAN
jgi:transcriptional regulator with PAS, ATPase and Fis domain